MATKAIIPFTGEIPQLPTQIEIDQNAAYPDRGVRYSRFFKHSFNQGKWELAPQKQFFKELGRTTSSGVISSSPTFITTISLLYNGLTGGSFDSIEFHDGSNSAAGLRWSSRLPSSGTDIHAQVWTFPTPLQFPAGMWYQNGTTHSGGSLILRVWGWTE